MTAQTDFKVGDYVRARPGFLTEPNDDRHEPLAEHFGGRIISLDPAEGYALINLDPSSLAHRTAEDVRQMDEEGLDRLLHSDFRPSSAGYYANTWNALAQQYALDPPHPRPRPPLLHLPNLARLRKGFPGSSIVQDGF